jgi:integrase
MYEADCATSGVEPDDSVFADLRWHDLRHCAVTSWATTGALSLPELMAVSGHKTPRMLTRYTHLSASSLAAKLAGIAV